MIRTLQAVAVFAVVLTSTGVGFVIGVARMASGEPIAPVPAPPPRWERSV